NSREIWKSLQCAPQFARVSQPHMPLKSGFPSAVRGVGAVMSGLPSAVRGTPGVGYSSHWAEAAAGSAITKAAKYVRRNTTGIACPPCCRMLSQEPRRRVTVGSRAVQEARDGTHQRQRFPNSWNVRFTLITARDNGVPPYS